MKKIIALALMFTCILCLLCGCGDIKPGNSGSTAGTDSSNTGGEASTSMDVDFSQTDDDMFTDRDRRDEYDGNSITIQFNGSSVSCNSDSVQVSGTTVTITQEATYILTGTLDDGMVIVDAGDTAKLQLVLDNASINSKTSAPLYILEADKVFVTLAENSANSLTNGGNFNAIDESNIDGAVFSRQDLTFNGSGSLTITSPAGHGIVCKDDLVFTGGSYTIGSASHGLDANDSVRITNAQLSIDSGKDGIHAENSDDASLGFVYVSGGTIEIEAEGDGISAEAYMQIEGGSFGILTGGGSENGTKASSDQWGDFMGGGMGGGKPGRRTAAVTATADTSASDESSTSIKGLKATGSMLINSGSFTINSADDAIHANAVTINGGAFEIATGDDGVHADETLTITDCTMNITESYEGLEALNIAVSGGDITLVASDDGLNAAGGTDNSGMTGGRDMMFGGGGMFRGSTGGSSNGSIVISGGTLNVTASGDGLDANGTLTISGGYTVVSGPTQGDTATLDYDVSGIITGGTFIGTGASGMAQTFSDSEQGVYAVSVGTQAAGTTITLKDKDGNTVITHTPELSFSVVILSSPDIVKGEIYTITVGSQSGEFEAT